MRRFTCPCGHVLFFGSFRCLSCGGEVGYDARGGAMALVGAAMKRCDNGLQHNLCNWLLPAAESQSLCIACRTNRTIPSLATDRNRTLWARMEMAKRRLLVTLLRLGLSVPSRSEDPRAGLAFDIVSTVANPAVTTGHLDGVITVDLEEADDAYRQFNRERLGESSRTLLGHFRHESGHYLWHRFLANEAWDAPLRLAFRERFGDDQRDYGAALGDHYRAGAPAGWEQSFVTGYAASHPWEDWAETWAHYLQITDALETCESLGIQAQHLTLPLVMLPASAGALPDVLPQSAEADGAFLASLQRWMCLSTALNEVSQSLGEPPLYPFVTPTPVARKLRLAHHFAAVWGR